VYSQDFGPPVVVTNITASEAVISIMLGHVIYHINRNRFFQQRSLRVKKQKLKQLATRDQMTGLLKRRTFMLRAQEEFHRARRMDSTFSVLMIDLDQFKRINDKFGHLVGDRVLEHVGEIIRRNIRHSDIAGRLGGEEFCLIVPETSFSGASVLADRLREEVRERVFEGPGEETFRITCSIGITEYRVDIRNTEKLINEADQALYRAKESGRDQTAVNDNV
jgi:diguanylate cyclase (GGDEF)-like protein